MQVPRTWQDMTSEAPDGAAEEVRAQREALQGFYTDLVATYYTAIVRYVYSMVSNTPLAEDLTQDTFLKAYLALPGTGIPESPKAWLYRIATNTSLDHLRRRNRIGIVALDKLAHILRGRNQLASVDNADPIERAMAQIRTDERAILLLFAEGGLNAPEVADVLGISAAAARKRRQRAREAFSRAYAEVTR